LRTEELPLQKPIPSTLTAEQEIAELKKEEMELAQKVMKDFPDSDDSYALMGDLYSRHGNSAEAMKFWKRSLEINPKRSDVYQNMGQLALEKGEFDKAVTLWRKVLEIRPKASGVRNDIARALMDSGKYSQALTELKEEIKISPRSIIAHFLLAEAYLQRKEYDKARKYYEATIELEPNNVHAHHGLITVFSRLGQRDKAKEYLAMFKKLKTKYFNAYMGRHRDTAVDLASVRASTVRMYLGAERLHRVKGDTREAERLLKRASEIEPANTLCLERLASLYYTTNRAPEALEHFERFSQIDPNNAFCYLNIGQVSTSLRLFDKAERAFQKSIALAPSKPGGYKELARLYLRINRKLPQARKLAQRALDLEKTADSYFVLGWASDVNGDQVKALEAMEQAIKLQPHNQKFRRIYERIKARN
jgi:tetratricopeptide (TPR) repeat protein